MALRRMCMKSEFDLLALKFVKMTKIHKLAYLGQFLSEDNEMGFELLVTVSNGTYSPPTGVCH